MTLDAEALIDRRALKSRLTLWRLLAILAVLVLVGVLIYQATSSIGAISKRDQIARVTLTGLITEDRKQLELLKKNRQLRSR